MSKKVKVSQQVASNPAERYVWVSVERMKSLRFRGADGAIVKIDLKPTA